VASVMVESLFSEAGDTFDDRRASTLPIHVEEQMFLKANIKFWSEEAILVIQRFMRN